MINDQRKNPPFIPPLSKGEEVDFLSRAAEIASAVDPHRVRPNPRVGCVIVQSSIINDQLSKKIISEGVHEYFGGPHAEVNALKNVADCSDCEVYVTLEPCDHFSGKKTPSCTEFLISQKPKKIVVGSLDPKFQGKNVEALRRAGIEVEVRDCPQCRALNPFFQKFVKTGMPFVTLKLAQSLDGRITSPHPQPLSRRGERVAYISNELSRAKVHQMRAMHSAILTTTETILTDDPRLDCRLDEFFPSPPTPLPQGGEESRKSSLNPPFFKGGSGCSNPDVVIVGNRKIPKTAKIFSPSPPTPLPQGERSASFPSLQSSPAGGEGSGKSPLNRNIYFFPTHDVEHVLRECAKMGIDSLLTECGATMATELLQKNLVDEIQLFIAPEIFGKGKSGFATTKTFSLLQDFELVDVQNLDGDAWLRFVRI